jgi:hypothetical protein
VAAVRIRCDKPEFYHGFAWGYSCGVVSPILPIFIEDSLQNLHQLFTCRQSDIWLRFVRLPRGQRRRRTGQVGLFLIFFHSPTEQHADATPTIGIPSITALPEVGHSMQISFNLEYDSVGVGLALFTRDTTTNVTWTAVETPSTTTSTGTIPTGSPSPNGGLARLVDAFGLSLWSFMFVALVMALAT